jgi:two-component system, chemotaxis family, sensor kinase CheA
MTEREQALRQRLLVTFRSEAAEHIASLSRDLLDLERTADGEAANSLIESAFRCAHSLKGAARAVNLPDIESLCQALEGVLAKLKRGELGRSSALLDLLLQAVGLLEQCLRATTETDSPRLPLGATLEALAQARAGVLPPPVRRETPAPAAPAAPIAPVARPPPPVPSAEAGREDTVRVSTTALDAVGVQIEELLVEKLAAAQQAEELQALRTALSSWQQRWAITRADLPSLANRPNSSPSSGALPSGAILERMQDFLQWNTLFMDDVRQRLQRLAQAARQHERGLSVKTDHLFQDTQRLLMLPADWLLEGLRRIVRDLARDQGKEAVLVIEGGAIEIDRRTLTELKDPFIHLLRNCIDHGIELPEQRERAGKPRSGTITIAITRVPGERVEMSVTDDGRGIDPDAVKAAAIKSGCLEAADAERMSDEAALDLVFQSEVTTSPLVTDLSGRGLGLAIVREKAAKLGGSATVSSRSGKGTTLRLVVPWGRAVFRGIVVRSGARFLVVPTAHVERVLRVERGKIRTVENRETISLPGRVLSLVRLSDLLGGAGEASKEGADARKPALVLISGPLRLACLVDEVCAEQEVVVKSLGPQLQRLPHVTGATIIAAGRIAPILDTTELVRAAVRWSETGASIATAAKATPTTGPRRILVAEDSITSRTLLKSILEAAGFAVATAVDGLDALTQLRTGEFDLVVSDVDMPRLDGIGLTMRIRADHALAKVPVVLVTSLDSREDRERGIEAGANAYIVKRSFEQSNLLEVVQRLL